LSEKLDGGNIIVWDTHYAGDWQEIDLDDFKSGEFTLIKRFLPEEKIYTYLGNEFQIVLFISNNHSG